VQKALKEDPYNGAYLDSLGWIYFKENKLTDFGDHPAQGPWNANAMTPPFIRNLGDLYAKMGTERIGRRGMGKVAGRMAALAARGHGSRQGRRTRKEAFAIEASRGAKSHIQRREAVI